jgi:5-formyltetrahydrofolate cyclo-ligase
MSEGPRPAGPVVAAKGELRRRLLAARSARSPEALVRESQRLAHVAAAAIPTHAVAVAAYAAFGTEPGTRPLIDALRSRGLRVLLPVLRPDGDLEWAMYDGWEHLVPGRRGLMEPAGPRLGVHALAGADVALVPALAVDRMGRRLGRGGGSFDRALCRVDRARTLALVYDDEVLDEVPAEPHDCRVGGAITPARLLPFLGSGRAP